eukprot:1200027-Amphidinium_carterae.2
MATDPRAGRYARLACKTHALVPVSEGAALHKTGNMTSPSTRLLEDLHQMSLMARDQCREYWLCPDHIGGQFARKL